jgi:hypothetical protein
MAVIKPQLSCHIANFLASGLDILDNFVACIADSNHWNAYAQNNKQVKVCTQPVLWLLDGSAGVISANEKTSRHSLARA